MRGKGPSIYEAAEDSILYEVNSISRRVFYHVFTSTLHRRDKIAPPKIYGQNEETGTFYFHCYVDHCTPFKCISGAQLFTSNKEIAHFIRIGQRCLVKQESLKR